jgi:predicted Zn-dependent protease
MYFAAGAQQQATQFALRARDMLAPGTAEWTRAMDIVFASGATQDDVDALDRRNDQRRRPAVIPAGG